MIKDPNSTQRPHAGLDGDFIIANPGMLTAALSFKRAGIGELGDQWLTQRSYPCHHMAVGGCIVIRSYQLLR